VIVTRLIPYAARVLTAVLLLWQPVPAPASDVPYVPTPDKVVDAMLQMGGVGKDDYLVDLGSGDGRISIRAATRFGTRGFGVDIDDSLVQTARAEAQKRGVSDKVAFEARDLFNADISRATVVTAYLLHGVNLRLRPMLFEQLRPGTRIVTHDFDFGDWPSDRKLTIDVPDKPYGPPRSDIMLWVMPANASGTWQWSLPGPSGELRYQAQVTQRFQMPKIRVTAQGRELTATEVRLNGTLLSFVLDAPGGPRRYSGEISGNTLHGQSAGGAGQAVSWQATRIKAGRMDYGTGTTPFAVGN
jgi:hypothetical protein